MLNPEHSENRLGSQKKVKYQSERAEVKILVP